MWLGGGSGGGVASGREEADASEGPFQVKKSKTRKALLELMTAVEKCEDSVEGRMFLDNVLAAVDVVNKKNLQKNF